MFTVSVTMCNKMIVQITVNNITGSILPLQIEKQSIMPLSRI